MTEPSRAACGACHDDVNFATGVPTTPAESRRMTPSAPTAISRKVRSPFDASIMGAHVVPTDTAATYPQNPDTLLAGINLAITGVTNTLGRANAHRRLHRAGQQRQQHPVIADLELCNSPWPAPPPITATPVSAATSPRRAMCRKAPRRRPAIPAGTCTYTFTHAIPADATGTYTIGGEARSDRDGVWPAPSPRRPVRSGAQSGDQLLRGWLGGGSRAAPWWR